METAAERASVQLRPLDWDPAGRRAAEAAAGFAVFAGLLHLYLAPQHMGHPGHGLFLLTAGALQVGWGIAFSRRPSSALWSLGVVLAGVLIALWAITRLLPAPFGHGGPEEMDAFGVLSKAAEGAGLAMLLAMILVGRRSREIPRPTQRSFWALLMVAGIGGLILYGGGLATERVLPWLGSEDEENLAEQFGLSGAASALPLASSASSVSEAAPSRPSAPEAGPTAAPGMDSLPSLTELLRVLVRDGVGPLATHVRMVYAPPLLFQVSGQERPASSLQRPAIIFMMTEDGHQNCDAIPDRPAEVFLRLDQGEPVRPFEVTVLRTDEDHMERTTRLLFPLPAGFNPGTLAEETRTLNIVVPLESGRETVFTWQLPLPLPTKPQER